MVDFDEFHCRTLPPLLATGHGVAAARAVGPGAALAFRLRDGGGAYTYCSDGSDLTVVAGDHAPVVVELDRDAFTDLVTEAWSVFGLLYGDRVVMGRGTFAEFAQWEAPLQAAWFDRPIYGAETAVDLVDSAGRPLDLSRSFTLEDDPAGAADFLSTAGFLLLRQVFSPGEIDELRAVTAEEHSRAFPGDGRSWWATRADGREICCRLTYMAKRSPLVMDLAFDDRLTDIAALADPEMRPCVDRLEGVSVVIKHPQVTAGLSDLPWHRDCGVGGHRVLCPGLNVGIQLDRADAANGQLHFLAGSQHHASQVLTSPENDGLPVVSIETEPGDVTVHFGHTMHASPPPSSPDAGRRVMYVGYHLPVAFDVVNEGQSYNDVLVGRDAGRVKSVDEVVSS